MKKEITAVIFDWAGTTIDQGSCGPIHAFIEIFAAKGIVISGEQVRGPMGMHKLAHIKKLAEIPEVNDQWIKKHGKPPQEKDFDELFSMFEPALEKFTVSGEVPEGGVADATATGVLETAV